MSDAQEHPTPNPTRKWLMVAIAAIALVAAAAMIIPRIYAANESSDVAAPSLAPSSSETTEQQTELEDAQLTITNGSYAGYRVEEVLNGADVTVVGRTEQVSGDATIENGMLTTANAVVDLASVTTDSDRRDNYFRTKAIDTSVHPEAVFTLLESVSLENLAADPVELTVRGELSMNGQTQEVTVPLQVARQGEQLVVVGNVPVTWSDYGVEAPNMGFVSVEDDGFLEFQLNFSA